MDVEISRRRGQRLLVPVDDQDTLGYYAPKTVTIKCIQIVRFPDYRKTSANYNRVTDHSRRKNMLPNIDISRKRVETLTSPFAKTVPSHNSVQLSGE